MQLYINGEALEMPMKSITLACKSVVYGFDKQELSRSQTLSIPLTPHNNRLLGFVGRPYFYGTGARVVLSATLMLGIRQIYGSLTITDATADEAHAVFTFGELQGLRRLREAGNIATYWQPSDNIVVRKGGNYNSGQALDVGQWYMTNGESVTPGASWSTPGVKMSYLLTGAASALGVTLGAGLTSTRAVLLPGSLNAPVTIVDTRTLGFLFSAGWSNTGSPFSTYFQPYNAAVRGKNYIGVTSVQPIHVLRCVRPCRLLLGGVGVNPHGENSVPTTDEQIARHAVYNVGIRKIVGWDNITHIIEWDDLKAKIAAECTTKDVAFIENYEVGDTIAWLAWDLRNGSLNGAPWLDAPAVGAGYTINSYIQAVGGSCQLTQDSISWNMGPWYLRDNLPAVTLAKMMQLVAQINGTVVYYNETYDRFDAFDWDFDGAGGAVVAIEPILIKVGKVERRVFDFAQDHLVYLQGQVALDDYARQNAEAHYYTANKTLQAASESRIDGANAPRSMNVTSFPTAHLIFDYNSEWNDAQGTTQLVARDTMIAAFGSISGPPYGWLEPFTVRKEAYLQTICDLATRCEVEVSMSDTEAAGLTSFTRYTYAGGWYFATDWQIAGGRVKLTLQRYK